MITYETISSVHRAEKGLQLSKLPEGFFPAVQLWLSHKKSRGDAAAILEVENAKKLLEYIINLRMRKIMTSALDSVRGSAPPANMTADEAGLFDRLHSMLKAQQNEMKERLFGASFMIEQKMEEARKSLEEMKGQNTPNISKSSVEIDARPTTPLSSASTPEKAENIAKEPQLALNNDQKPLKPLNSTKKVRILMELPRFVDMNGAEYGPFKAGDTAEVSDDVFKLLSIRRAAETVN
jgi:DNA replication initiation complex subunit (GINS family)